MSYGVQGVARWGLGRGIVVNSLPRDSHSRCAYLETDYDALKVVAALFDVVTHFLHVDVVQRCIDLIHHEEGRWAETVEGADAGVGR